MTDTILLVDFENVGKIDLAGVPEGFVVTLFFGAAQKSVPKEFLKAAVKLRERFISIDIEGQGKNALDSGSTKNRRPRTRKALAAYLYSHFAKKVPEEEVLNLIERLIASGQLSEADGRIAYHISDTGRS